ncbi:MAG: hypothetical protein WDN66_00320 [Candidatus Saccharibacteria bacterium]
MPSRLSAFKEKLADKRNKIAETISSIRERHGRAIGRVALVGAAAIGFGSTIAETAPAAANEHKSEIVSSLPNFNSLRLNGHTPKAYESGAFLPTFKLNPHAKTSLEDQAGKEVESWFSAKGPLNGNKAVRGSIAAEFAALVAPSTKGPIDNSFSYSNEYNQAMNLMNTGSKSANKSTAQHNATKIYKVMARTASYVKSATGSQFTQLKAKYGKNGDIINVYRITLRY